uniref:Uncharacterized protein n=1 Tax=Tetranychus urticae TaxID=32264 RepID=T1K8V5_TETUR
MLLSIVPVVFKLMLIVSWSSDLVKANGCEDIQSLMDNTVREDCSATGLKTRGGSICVPQIAGPLLLFNRRLSSQPMAMRSFTKPTDEQLMIGYYPKLDKCFLVTRTVCQIKGATIDRTEPRIFWIEICPDPDPVVSDSVPSAKLQAAQSRVRLHRTNLDGTGHEWSPFDAPLENWYNINIDVDSINKKLYVITIQETLECDISGFNCVTFDRPSEGSLLASRID